MYSQGSYSDHLTGLIPGKCFRVVAGFGEGWPIVDEGLKGGMSLMEG